MRKTRIISVAFITMFSYGLFAMGLGDISVNSFLNQPFNADIELIDVGNTPLSEIKASLASPEDFERVGLERAYSLGLLTLTVEKHNNGRVFIKVSSVEGITEPFMQLLVDLAWADGQVYRSYTVLLDPPNYQLTMVKAQLHKIIKQQSGEDDKTVYSTVERIPGKSTSDSQGLIVYGPTLPNETIWQVAQRYKSDDFLLQQMILAIVGINPQAFTDGNLNGLKDGSRLKIPDNSMVKQVSSELSISEVLAQDKAWQTKGPIEHTLLPPYINTTAPDDSNKSANGDLRSYIPASPIHSSELSSNNESDSVPLFTAFSSFISGKDGAASEAKLDANDTVLVKEVKLKSDIDIAAAAIDSIRQSNGMLVEQLKRMQTSNKQLQKQLMESKRNIKRLHHKIQKLMIQKGTTGQRTQPSNQVEKRRIFPWIIMLFELSIIIGLVIWWLWSRFKSKADAVDSALINPAPSSESVAAPFFDNNIAASEPVNDTSENKVVLPESPERKEVVSNEQAEKADTKGMEMVETPLDVESSVDMPTDDLAPKHEIISTKTPSLIKDKSGFLEEKIPLVQSSVEPTIPPESESRSNEPGIKELVEEEIIPEKIKSTSVVNSKKTERGSKPVKKDITDQKEEKLDIKKVKAVETPLGGEVSLTKPDVEIKPAEAINSPEGASLSNEPVINPEDSKPIDEQEGSDEDCLLEFEPGIKEIIEEEIIPEKIKSTSVVNSKKTERGSKPVKKGITDQKEEKLDIKEAKAVETPLEGEVSLTKLDVEIKPTEAINSPEGASPSNEPVLHIEDSKPIDEKEGSDEDYLIEFEPGIKEVVEEEIILGEEVKTKGTPEKSEVPDKKDESTIDFDSNSVDEISPLETSNPVKSGAALDTLLALGKTYIGMDDIEAARQSLQEVSEFGNEAQQKQAKQLLDDLNKKQ